MEVAPPGVPSAVGPGAAPNPLLLRLLFPASESVLLDVEGCDGAVGEAGAAEGAAATGAVVAGGAGGGDEAAATAEGSPALRRTPSER